MNALIIIALTIWNLIESVESIKDLGVTFDSHLMFDLHISETINKAC